MACTARARRRSTSSSSCSASSRAARAWSDDGLKRVAHASRQWISDRSAGEESLAQGFLEQRGRATDALELGKEDKSLGAPGTRSSVREETGENRSRARPFARATLGARRSERSTMPVAVGAWRRKPESVLGELGGGDRGATRARQGRGVLEGGGDLGVRALGRKREMAGAVERVRDDRCEASVRAPSLVRRTRSGRPPTRAAGA